MKVWLEGRHDHDRGHHEMASARDVTDRIFMDGGFIVEQARRRGVDHPKSDRTKDFPGPHLAVPPRPADQPIRRGATFSERHPLCHPERSAPCGIEGSARCQPLVSLAIAVYGILRLRAWRALRSG